MERKRLVPDRTPTTEHTLAHNRARLKRAVRARNHIDAAALEQPAHLAGSAS